jgi:hypothetical protein
VRGKKRSLNLFYIKPGELLDQVRYCNFSVRCLWSELAYVQAIDKSSLGIYAV